MKFAKILIVVYFAAAVAVFAHEKPGNAGTKIVGEVIDTVCYVSHESRGLGHLECARECAAKGISLGILQEKTGRVYLSLPIDHSSPNEKLLEFIARRVEVRGAIFRKGGLTGIFVHSVRELPASMPSRGLKR